MGEEGPESDGGRVNVAGVMGEIDPLLSGDLGEALFGEEVEEAVLGVVGEAAEQVVETGAEAAGDLQ